MWGGIICFMPSCLLLNKEIKPIMKTVLYSISVITLFLTVNLFQGCSDDTNPVAPGGPNVSGLTLIGEQYAIGGRAKVLMYTNGELKTGYNKIYIVMYDSVTNNLITNSHVEFSPVNHGVTAPFENPAEDAVDGIFTGAIVFTDPQIADHWHLHVHVHNHQAPGEPNGEAEFEGFTVLDSPERVKKFQPDSTTTFLFSLIEPIDKESGLHDYEFLVSELVGAAYEPFPWFNFDSLGVSLGGVLSSDNVMPVPTGNGHYKGKVNLTSAGDWNVFMRFQHHQGGPIYGQNIFMIHAH